jgi:transcriptional regulator with XRE-family HTH domain
MPKRAESSHAKRDFGGLRQPFYVYQFSAVHPVHAVNLRADNPSINIFIAYMVCLNYNPSSMKPSPLRSPVAVLRHFCGPREGSPMYQQEFADMIGCSRIYLQKIEQTPRHGGQKLSEKLAYRIFHETGISLDWLLAGNPKSPPLSARGEPYTRKLFAEAQAEKQYFDQQHPFFRNTNAIGFCAQLIAILENANAKKNYYMAAYKVCKALDSLRDEFGQDEQVYPVNNPSGHVHVVRDTAARAVLKSLITEAEQFDRRFDAFRIAQKKQSSPQRRKKKRA